ncbi:Long-chain-fatty-acid--CoA ligase FadD13 [Halioglobus japonicus]|nr:Long-chain-fatty-acid--CoA ligase FadD13 [Halioglobus japonicus]
MLVHNYLEYYARNTPDAPCFTHHDASLSYSEVDAIANQLGNGFLELGVQKEQRVAILGENSVEHCLWFMAASKVGAVSVPLNYRLAPAELAFIIGDSNTRVLFVLEGMESALDALRPLLSEDIVIITANQPDSLHWSDWIALLHNTCPSVEIGRDDPFIQLYTSGTTGNPKGVVTSHYNILQLTMMNVIATPNRPAIGTAGIICAPLFHIGGAGSAVAGIYNGQHTILHRVFDPMQILNDMEAYPVTSIFMVPAMIMAVLQVPDIEQRDFSRLKTMFYGASPISETVLRRAIEVFQCEFIQMYGMTETTGTVVSLSPGDHRRALAGKPELLRSCGRPSVGVEIKIMDTEGVEVETGEVGEIWVKSDTNMLCYYNLPEATTANLTDGWIHTGDAGYLDDEGYLYLKDRIKDMVVSGGENIYPVEVENALAKLEVVVDVAVIGVPNDKFGEALLAFVVIKEGMTLTVEEMMDFCRDKIAGYKIPRQLEIVEELPRNPSGKILKKVLREPYWDGVERGIG